MTTKQLSIDDIQEHIISTEKVAHVTFYIVKIEAMSERKLHCSHEYREDCYHVYSESEKTGLRLISQGFEYQQNDTGSYDDALVILRGEIQRLEEILERKRKGPPTQKQVYFLFCEKIPIPVDLTWGQASDLIDERLSQIPKDRQAKRLERFNGFVEGDNVSWTQGRETLTGQITKLYQAGSAGKFALIKGENGTTYRVQRFDSLKKINGEVQ